MAKYLGGIKNPDIKIYDIKSPDWYDFDFIIKYADYGTDGHMQDLSICNTILRYDELTSDSRRDYSLGWGAVGYILTGPVGGILGAVLGSEKKEKHIVLCELENGWQPVIELDKDDFETWEQCMSRVVKNNKDPNSIIEVLAGITPEEAKEMTEYLKANQTPAQKAAAKFAKLSLCFCAAVMAIVVLANIFGK